MLRGGERSDGLGGRRDGRRDGRLPVSPQRDEEGLGRVVRGDGVRAARELPSVGRRDRHDDAVAQRGGRAVPRHDVVVWSQNGAVGMRCLCPGGAAVGRVVRGVGRLRDQAVVERRDGVSGRRAREGDPLEAHPRVDRSPHSVVRELDVEAPSGGLYLEGRHHLVVDCVPLCDVARCGSLKPCRVLRLRGCFHLVNERSKSRDRGGVSGGREVFSGILPCQEVVGPQDVDRVPDEVVVGVRVQESVIAGMAEMLDQRILCPGRAVVPCRPVQ